MVVGAKPGLRCIQRASGAGQAPGAAGQKRNAVPQGQVETFNEGRLDPTRQVNRLEPGAQICQRTQSMWCSTFNRRSRR